MFIHLSLNNSFNVSFQFFKYMKIILKHNTFQNIIKENKSLFQQ